MDTLNTESGVTETDAHRSAKERPSRIEGDSRLWATGLTKIYKKRPVVERVDIEVSQGEIVGLLG
ncbi:hypothetical protein OAJ07_05485, partial [Gemmatimonadales bacterium]|nr:hypothetical protein [Gemmatimonadales bacterium]